MRPAVVLATMLLLTPYAPTARASQESGGLVVSMRGCVSGSLLKSVVADTESEAGSLVSSDRYRMVGTKALKAQIKKANKALVRVTGRVKPGPQPVVKGTKMGGTSIGIGVAPGSGSMDQQTPYTPTIEVDAITVIAKTC